MFLYSLGRYLFRVGFVLLLAAPDICSENIPSGSLVLSSNQVKSQVMTFPSQAQSYFFVKSVKKYVLCDISKFIYLLSW